LAGGADLPGEWAYGGLSEGNLAVRVQ